MVILGSQALVNEACDESRFGKNINTVLAVCPLRSRDSQAGNSIREGTQTWRPRRPLHCEYPVLAYLSTVGIQVRRC